MLVLNPDGPTSEASRGAPFSLYSLLQTLLDRDWIPFFNSTGLSHPRYARLYRDRQRTSSIMLVLGVDTSSGPTSVALWRRGELAVVDDPQARSAETLFSLLQILLDRAGYPFLIRRGYLTPDTPDYIEIVSGLHRSCSS